MRVKAETEGRTKDVGLLDVTPENFIVPKGEENCYHCRIEVVKFHSETGKRLSKPRIQVFGKKFFETFGLHNLRKQGFKGRLQTKKRLKPINVPKQKPQHKPQQKQKQQNGNR